MFTHTSALVMICSAASARINNKMELKTTQCTPAAGALNHLSGLMETLAEHVTSVHMIKVLLTRMHDAHHMLRAAQT
jgi:hypothetical protein